MNISIPKSNKTAILKYDLFGNLYFIYDDIYYNVIIGKKNNLELLKIKKNKMIQMDQNNIDFQTGKLISGVPLLKGIIHEKEEKEGYGDEEDKEYDDEFEDGKNKTDIYFPENKFLSMSDNEFDHDFAETYDIEPMFKFYNHDNNCTSEFGYPFNADYNFLVINGVKESKNVVLASEEFNNGCSYRITVYTCGILKCNVIGSYEKFYKLILDNTNQLSISLE